MNTSVFPTLYAMAMDYLPIQASSVPCERIFSSSAETDTKRRNRIGAPLMEALQIQKFIFKKERLNFMEGWMVHEQQLVEDDLEVDLLRMLLDTQNGRNNFDNVMRIINQCDG